MKKLICILFAVFLCTTSASADYPQVSAQSAIVIDAAYGNVLYEKNASQRLTMASTTKIMTAICAIEEGSLDTKVKIHPDAVGVEGSSIYLTHGEELTLRELVCGLMLNSGNDAAVAIAYAVAGGVDKFADIMNKKAEKIGVKNTHFCNPNGLDEDGHYTTAEDLAKITAYALKNEEFRKIVSTYQMTVSGPEGKRYLTNHNKLLKRMDGCIGVKTGFTKKSGRCLVSACERDGVVLAAVTLNAPDDWNDHMNMMDYAYGRISRKSVLKESEYLCTIPVKKGTASQVSVVSSCDFAVPAVDGVKYVSVYRAPLELTAPIKKGDKLGKVEVYMNDSLVDSFPAVAGESVGEDTTRTLGETVITLLSNYLERQPPSDR